MKHLLLTTIVAVLVVGCGESTHQESDLSPLSISPLLDAASEGNIEAAKQAIADGEDVNVTAGGGMNSLHYAALDGHKEIAELLIAKGTDINKKNIAGSTPLDWAIEENHTELANLLRKHGGKTGEELKAEGK